MSEDREALIEEILALDNRIYQVIKAGPSQEWLDIDISLSQVRILFLLYAGGDSRMGQLASALGVRLSTMTGAVDRLVALGLVSRRDDPHDRRLVIASLTDEGFNLIDGFYQGMRTSLARVVRRLSTDDLILTARAFEALYKAALEDARERKTGAAGTAGD
jgi:DNA-binding MarR family transcriptional regulator